MEWVSSIDAQGLKIERRVVQWGTRHANPCNVDWPRLNLPLVKLRQPWLADSSIIFIHHLKFLIELSQIICK